MAECGPTLVIPLTPSSQFVVVHSQCTKLEGRKAWTEGSISTLDGKLLVDAKCARTPAR